MDPAIIYCFAKITVCNRSPNTKVADPDPCLIYREAKIRFVLVFLFLDPDQVNLNRIRNSTENCVYYRKKCINTNFHWFLAFVITTKKGD